MFSHYLKSLTLAIKLLNLAIRFGHYFESLGLAIMFSHYFKSLTLAINF
jgi:hypothetical protein